MDPCLSASPPKAVALPLSVAPRRDLGLEVIDWVQPGILLALQGELCAISNLQTTFTVNCVLMTVTVKVLMGVHISTIFLSPSRSPCRSWSLRKQLTLVLGISSNDAVRFSIGHIGTCSRAGSRSL